MWYIYNMMKYPLANTLVIRKTFNAHKDSTWTQLKWAANNLNVSHLWKFSKSPLEATYLPTNQKILFRGMDDPMSITSITVEHGYLCWAWFEEAYQISNEDDFNKRDMSIRGDLPQGYFKQLTLTFNPWSEKSWLKKRFFDNQDENTLAMTTTYKCNEFLGEDDISIFESMKKNNSRRYTIEGLGAWGIAEGLIYDNFIEEEFDYREIAKMPKVKGYYGLDFGYSADPTAFVAILLDDINKNIYVYDEDYEKAMTNQDIAKMLKYKGYAKEQIICDSAEPKSIQELKIAGIQRASAASKGKDSILNGIQFIQNYKIIVHPKCENVLIELNNYVWDTKEGLMINKPIDDYNQFKALMIVGNKSAGAERKVKVWDTLDVQGTLAVQGKQVIASGSANSGRFIRYSDGTQICVGAKWIGSVAMTNVITTVYTNTSVGLSGTTLTFAANFISNPYCVANCSGSGYMVAHTAGVTTSNCTIRAWVPYATTADNVQLEYVAIGRWY